MWLATWANTEGKRGTQESEKAMFSWDAMSCVLGLKQKPGASEPVAGGKSDWLIGC